MMMKKMTVAFALVAGLAACSGETSENVAVDGTAAAPAAEAVDDNDAAEPEAPKVEEGEEHNEEAPHSH
jgi:ABC-type glycerol-3-phosphate transport system substrate-binding protein